MAEQGVGVANCILIELCQLLLPIDFAVYRKLLCLEIVVYASIN